MYCSLLRVYGCACFIHVLNSKWDNLQAEAMKCIFLPCFRMVTVYFSVILPSKKLQYYDPVTGKIFSHGCHIFSLYTCFFIWRWWLLIKDRSMETSTVTRPHYPHLACRLLISVSFQVHHHHFCMVTKLWFMLHHRTPLFKEESRHSLKTNSQVIFWR